MILEICANSYQSAKNAQDAGAHRIELCQELSVGGITPSYGLLKKVVGEIDIPVFVLIRPRSGNFVYTDDEFQIMKNDIQLCKDLGYKGIVSGILKADRTLDVQRTQTLIDLAKPLSFTFHRAFDEIKNPKEALLQLIDMGADRVLTSGQKATAEEGLELLKELHSIAENKLTIIAGGGVSEENVMLFKEVGLIEVHASASTTKEASNSMFSMPITFSDLIKIKAILDAI
ncbi:copper homeostasis protein CutC [Winogradskyella aquimaris]|uniref:PF03932 family protein CutC n=1 Tax=Winogradskyella aquimaris TaxID=864074 RepID=A0ABU5EJ90_9FLAO|nr:copper homeostasis protein CutC [Winogradskyella aquimaris]MDY2586273.1 copper homeostasis protein CutC [Winogradskyella aquimaris]